MSKPKPDPELREREIERFNRNLENFAKTTPDQAAYHRYQGMLENQVVTLMNCGVITRNASIKLFEQISLVMRSTQSRLESSDNAERT